MKRQRSRPRNRRVSNFRQRRQQHLLDVKVRSRTATQHRNRRILVVVSKTALLLALVAGLYLGGMAAAKRFFFENPDYRLTAIEVVTDGTLLRDRVLEVANIREGENIFLVNLGRAHDQLQQLPQVDDVQIVRKLPGEIDIRITERKPIAWITSEKQIADPFGSHSAFLVDARGVLMKEKKLLPEYLGLPLITGCTGDTLEAGQIVGSFEAKTALDLLRLSTRSFMQTRFQIREIDLSKGYCLQVTDKNRSRVAFGFDELDAQLQTLEQLLVYCDDTKQELATANLLVKRNIPVTFGKPAVEVINDTVDPAEEPRALKATAVHPSQVGAVSAKKPKPKAGTTQAIPIKRAIPVEKEKRKTNGQ